MTRSGRSPAARVAFLTRFPEPGRVKTRLAESLGAERAMELHAEIAAHCFGVLRPLHATGEAVITVYFDAARAGPRDVARWLSAGLPGRVATRRQVAGDIGARIRAALEREIDAGAQVAIAVGSDCPELDATVARDAVGALTFADCVLGPARDGGYYLIGVRAERRRDLPALLEDVPWGTSAVLDATVKNAREVGLEVARLETLADVDRPEDLPVWETARAAERVASDVPVSVVIPALDEAESVGDAIRSALEAGAAEVIVADGGSTDDTDQEAERAGATVVKSPRGRAVQQNAGAQAASGDVLIFLHADTLLPANAAEVARDALADAGVSGGGFAFWSREEDPRSRMLAAGSRLRSGLTRHPYGDQALFVRSTDFRRLGGFPELPVMEDWEFVRRLKRLGRVRVLAEGVSTSTRSFIEHGFVRGLAVYAAVIAGYLLGVDVDRLAGWRSRVNARA